jgi:hypothetical protein
MHVYFEFEEGVPCNCNILCQTVTGDSSTSQYCPDSTSIVIVDYVAGNDPSSLVFQFSDALGNRSDLVVDPVFNILPTPPSTLPQTNPRRVEVGISRTTVGGVSLDDEIAYQIWKYEHSPSSARIWKDWNYRSYSTFTDTEVIPGRTYGYAVIKGNSAKKADSQDGARL